MIEQRKANVMTSRFYITRNERNEYETRDIRNDHAIVDVTRDETRAIVDCMTRNRLNP